MMGNSEQSPQNLKSNDNLSPYLITGLGNPGRAYRGNRHNVGFMVVDRLAHRLNTQFTRVESKTLITKVDYRGKKLILNKPQTYMNLSGSAVASLVRYYKISLANLLVIYDDVDLPLGILRLRPSGGSAGQKGTASIIDQLGTQDFPRLRIGIDHPPGRMQAADYVLQDFTDQENQLLIEVFDRAVSSILTFVDHGLDTAMNDYNG